MLTARAAKPSESAAPVLDSEPLFRPVTVPLALEDDDASVDAEAPAVVPEALAVVDDEADGVDDADAAADGLAEACAFEADAAVAEASVDAFATAAAFDAAELSAFAA